MTTPTAAVEVQSTVRRLLAWCLRGSCSLGVKGALKKNVNLITERCPRIANRTNRKFEHRLRLNPDCRHSPRFQIFFHVDDKPLPIQVHDVNGKEHGERVHAAA